MEFKQVLKQLSLTPEELMHEDVDETGPFRETLRSRKKHSLRTIHFSQCGATTE